MIIASEDFIKEVGNVRPEQWKKITETLKVVKGFIDVDTGVLESFKEDIKSTLSLKMEELLSPIQNSIDELWATALKPIMPFLQDVVGGIAVVIGWLADRIQDLIDFVQGDIEMGGYSFETFATWMARTGSTNIWEYFDYLKGIIGAGAGTTSTYLPRVPGPRRGGYQE